jgi:hypothetical protein
MSNPHAIISLVFSKASLYEKNYTKDEFCILIEHFFFKYKMYLAMFYLPISLGACFFICIDGNNPTVRQLGYFIIMNHLSAVFFPPRNPCALAIAIFIGHQHQIQIFHVECQLS